ncbi:hypothetical protein ALC60_12680 [Trachymyrmex zeteki]|uniref:Uncharacterized protein n=1 Tax=Mycetomoellerius zeteki TaxID=64791 RepID=A0A151WKP5_9HYME|nr:hypothetical protein ALC60_12680 [Trachymyrmex zeteki]
MRDAPMQTPHGHGSVLAATRGGSGGGGGRGADSGGGGGGRGGRRRRRCCRRRRRRRSRRDRGAARGHRGQARKRAGTSVRRGAAWRSCAEVARPVRRKGPEVAANRRANLRASRRARRAPAAPAPTLTAFLCHPPCPGGGTHTGLGYRTSPLPFLSHFLARGLVSSTFVCIFVFLFVPLKHVKWKRCIIIDSMKIRDEKGARD